MAEKAKVGRPSKCTQELMDRICAELPHLDGGLEEICRAEDMPTSRSVFRWLADPENVEFRQMYAHAREITGEIQAQRALADALEAKDAAIGRLRFDARRWAASKLAPKKYGDRIAHEHSGPDGGAIMTKTEHKLAIKERVKKLIEQRPADEETTANE